MLGMGRSFQNSSRLQALMRYRVIEGGLEPYVIGEFSRRACRVTSQLIFRRGRLGMRLSMPLFLPRSHGGSILKRTNTFLHVLTPLWNRNLEHKLY